MRKIKLLVIIMLALFFTGLLGWFARSVWDSVFYLHGRVHVVSVLPRKANISITFPSGEKKEFELDSFQSKNLYIENTGKGSITVVVDNKQLKCDSYVMSSMNPLIVLTLTAEKTIFSAVYNNKLL